MYKIIGTDQKEYGPITSDQVRAWIGEGRLNAQSPAQAEGVPGWKPLSMYPEFADVLPKTPPPGSLPPAPMPIPPSSVPNYLVPAILCTILCCCPPFGIVAIVYAAQVNSKLVAGDYEGAMASSRNAKLWCWLTFGFSLIIFVLWFALQFLGAILGSLE